MYRIMHRKNVQKLYTENGEDKTIITVKGRFFAVPGARALDHKVKSLALYQLS